MKHRLGIHWIESPRSVIMRKQIGLLLISSVQVLASHFVFGFFAYAFFTQSNVVVNDLQILVQGSRHQGFGTAEG